MKRSMIVLLFLAAILAVMPFTILAASFEPVYSRGEGTLVEVMKIGGGPDEGDDPPPFYKPYNACVGRDGTIYVLDQETSEILAFSRDLELRFKFGRRGEGPGELSLARDMQVDRFGRVVVADAGNKRFSLFSPAGKFVRTVPFAWDLVSYFEYLPDGRAIAEVSVALSSPTTMGSMWSLVVIDSTFHATTTLDSLMEESVVVRTKEGMFSANRAYQNDMLCAVSPDGNVYIGRARKYELSVLSKSLQRIRTISRTVPAVKTTAEERERYYRNMPPDVAAQMDFPEEKPPVMSLWCDSYGYLLVGRAQKPGTPMMCDVYRPDASFIGEVTIPHLWNPIFDGDTIILRQFPEEELPSLVRCRLE